MPAAARQENVVRYTPVAQAEPERDLIVVEQEEWSGFCGELTKFGLTSYLLKYFYNVGRVRSKEERQYEAVSEVKCCGVGHDFVSGQQLYTRFEVRLLVHVTSPNTGFRLLATAGELSGGGLGKGWSQETVSFHLENETSLRRPAQEIVNVRWLSGPWTTGGEKIAPPPLFAAGMTLRAPVPLYGSAVVDYRTWRWSYTYSMRGDEANKLLAQGWSEWVVCLPDGGRPVAVEIEPPPGMDELPPDGLNCGNRRGKDSGVIHGPDDDDEPPKANGSDKHVKCDYCKQECDKEDEE